MKKIVIIGPECTGKTSLTEALANHYACPWIPEYARKYMQELNGPYCYEDVEVIAKHQVKELAEFEKQYASKAYLFIDTDLILTKVWFMHVYKRCPDWIQAAIETNNINHFLICCPDLPWQYEPVRENGHLRDYFFDWYQREIEALGKTFSVVKGDGEERILSAINAIEKDSI